MSKVTISTVDLPNGETIGYRQSGNGPHRLLLVHGNMTSSKHMEILMDALDDRFSVLALDLRGFGLSTYNTPIRHLQDCSEDVKLFCDAIGWRDFALLGWSTGGGIAMQLIADHPGYANRLILMNSMSTRGYPFYALDEQFNPIVTERLRTLEQIQKQARNQALQHAYDQGDREFLRAVWNAVIYTHRRPPEALYEEYIDDMLTQRNLYDIYHGLNVFNISEVDNEAAAGSGAAKRVNVPTLVFWGRRDMVVPESMTLELLADLPHARAVGLEDCGHSPLIDRLDRLADTVASFVLES